MEYIVLIGLTLLCYGWLGNQERITRFVRQHLEHRRPGVTRRDRRM